jgi:hypothetical protein
MLHVVTCLLCCYMLLQVTRYVHVVCVTCCGFYVTCYVLCMLQVTLHFMLHVTLRVVLRVVLRVTLHVTLHVTCEVCYMLRVVLRVTLCVVVLRVYFLVFFSIISKSYSYPPYTTSKSLPRLFKVPSIAIDVCMLYTPTTNMTSRGRNM